MNGYVYVYYYLLFILFVITLSLFLEAMSHKVLLMKTMGSPRMSMSATDKRQPKPKPEAVYTELSYQQPYDQPDEESTLLNKHASADAVSPFSSTSFACLFVQSLPLLLVYPIRRIIIWFMIAGPWVELMRRGVGRFTALLWAMAIMRVTLAVLAPLTGIAVKWLLIGRYQPGRYPLWGSM